MPKRTKGGPAAPATSLLVPREKIEGALLNRIAAGRKLRKVVVWDETEFVSAWNSTKKWDQYNRELLRRSFSGDAIPDEYGSISWPEVNELSWEVVLPELDGFVSQTVACLESILERLELYDHAPAVTSVPAAPTPAPGFVSQGRAAPAPGDSTRVFIVHGHDEAAREKVARFVAHLGLQPVILHEAANAGRTILEKLLGESSVAFAVVLLTADDVAHSKAAPDKVEQRAPQNVILELGLFLGRLDRKRVCALYADGVALPSDFDGVVYVPLDANGGWQRKLAREFQEAGLPFEASRLLSA